MNRAFAHSGNFCRLLNITNQIAAEVAKRMCLCSLVSYVVLGLLYSMDIEKGCMTKTVQDSSLPSAGTKKEDNIYGTCGT